MPACVGRRGMTLLYQEKTETKRGLALLVIRKVQVLLVSSVIHCGRAFRLIHNDTNKRKDCVFQIVVRPTQPISRCYSAEEGRHGTLFAACRVSRVSSSGQVSWRNGNIASTAWRIESLNHDRRHHRSWVVYKRAATVKALENRKSYENCLMNGKSDDVFRIGELWLGTSGAGYLARAGLGELELGDVCAKAWRHSRLHTNLTTLLEYHPR